MTEIYRVSFGFVRANLLFFALMAGLLFAASVYRQFANSGMTVMLLAHAFIAYGLHRALMFGEINLARSSKTPLRPASIGRFMIVTFGLALIAIGLTIGGMLALPGGIARLQGNDVQFVATIFSLSGLASLVILSLFGTALPAAASADRFGFTLTLSRARQTWKCVAFGLVVGPGLAFLLATGGLSVLVILGLPQEEVYTTLGGFNLIAGVVDYLVTLVNLFVTLLTVTVLCLNYRKVAPPEVVAAMEEASAPTAQA